MIRVLEKYFIRKTTSSYNLYILILSKPLAFFYDNLGIKF